MAQNNRISTFDELWIELEKFMELVYRSSEQPPPDLYMRLYALVYDYCTKIPSAHYIVRNSQRTLPEGQPILGAQLYIKLKNYLQAYVKERLEEGIDLSGKDLLRFYSENWERYLFGSKATNDACAYLNRSWVQRQRGNGVKDVYKVYWLAMEVWQLIFFQVLGKQVTLACLQLIKAERNNEKIDTKLINSVINSYVQMDLSVMERSLDNHNQIKNPGLNIYKDNFEFKFLEDTGQFYRQESTNFLAHNSVTEYLKKVDQRLDEENQRIQSYLHESTSDALIKKVEEILIRDRIETIYAEAKELLRHEKHQDLALLFKLVNRLPNATLELEKIFEDHIRQMGIDAIQQINIAALNDSKVYVKTILDIYTKFSKLIQEVFNNEQSFTAVLDKVCADIINNNNTITIESLAQYRDGLLGEGHSTTESIDLEEKLNKIITLISQSKAKNNPF